MSTELTKQQGGHIAQPTAMQMLQIALEKDKGIDVIERLAKLQFEMAERTAKVEFDEALNRCQTKMRPISADMTNPQTRSRYASYAALSKVVKPIYTAEGFSLSFGEDEGCTPDYVRMLGYLSRSGHTRAFRKSISVDTKGPKGNDVMTKTHAAGSAGSYAKRYLLKDIFDLAVGEDDDDGNAAGNGTGFKALADALGNITAATDPDEVVAIARSAYKGAKLAGDQSAILAIIAAKDARLKELGADEA